MLKFNNNPEGANVAYGANNARSRVIKPEPRPSGRQCYCLQVRQGHLGQWATVDVYDYLANARKICKGIEVAFKLV